MRNRSFALCSCDNGNVAAGTGSCRWESSQPCSATPCVSRIVGRNVVSVLVDGSDSHPCNNILYKEDTILGFQPVWFEVARCQFPLLLWPYAEAIPTTLRTQPHIDANPEPAHCSGRARRAPLARPFA